MFAFVRINIFTVFGTQVLIHSAINICCIHTIYSQNTKRETPDRYSHRCNIAMFTSKTDILAHANNYFR